MVEEPELVGETQATMAGEDFSFIARAVPSCFLFLGIRNETLGSGGWPGMWGGRRVGRGGVACQTGWPLWKGQRVRVSACLRWPWLVTFGVATSEGPSATHYSHPPSCPCCCSARAAHPAVHSGRERVEDRGGAAHSPGLAVPGAVASAADGERSWGAGGALISMKCCLT